MTLKEMTTDNKNCVASEISFNLKAESEATEYYYKLINMVADEDKDKIKEIISDELDHMIILGKLNEKYSGVLPNEYNPLIYVKKKEGK